MRQLANAVLDHDDRAVDNQPEIDRSQTHQTGCYAGEPHHVGGEQHRQRNRQSNNDAGAKVAQHQQQHDDYQHAALSQIRKHGFQRASDQCGPIIGHFQRHTGRQGAFDLVEPLLGRADHLA